MLGSTLLQWEHNRVAWLSHTHLINHICKSPRRKYLNVISSRLPANIAPTILPDHRTHVPFIQSTITLNGRRLVTWNKLTRFKRSSDIEYITYAVELPFILVSFSRRVYSYTCNTFYLCSLWKCLRHCFTMKSWRRPAQRSEMQRHHCRFFLSKSPCSVQFGLSIWLSFWWPRI